MSDRLAWAVAALLAVAAAVQAHALVKPESGFATMPIFVPLSLEHERAMRDQRGQPAGRGGEEALETARRLAEGPVDATLRPKVEALKETRVKLLDARGRRHALNIRMMDAGVALASVLTPEQWDRVHMRRDALRARIDAETFDRVLEKLR
jgi:hypothetical protein